MTTLAALLTASQLSKYTQMTLNQKKAWDVFFPCFSMTNIKSKAVGEKQQ